ncbi:MAG: ABC transporter substrate-binding protein [Desulfocapsaceae bacterium]|nr:ABC transporter substrate-binding protein [Desulfocapsaceae bacterium]
MKNPGMKLWLVAILCLLAVPAVWAKDDIPVGAVLAVTGPASFLGGPEARSLEMLVDELNAKGGVDGAKIRLIIKDTGSSPEKAVSFAKQLIEENHVIALLGPSTSGETMALKKIAEESRTPLLSCASAEVIVDPLASYVFKVPQNDSFAAEMIFQEMNRQRIVRVALLSDNTGFGQAGKEQVEKIAPKYGIEIVDNEVYDKSATDLSAIIAKIKADPKVQAVINWSIVPAQAIVAKNMRQAGWDVPLFQSHGFANIKYAEAGGAASNGIIFPAGRLLIADLLPEGHPQKALLTKYVHDYEAKYKENASTFGGHGVDVFNILVAALKAVGPNKEKIPGAIEQLKNFPGTGGVYNFSPTDHNGLGIDAFEMMTVKDGKFVPYTR